jgi:hypothetical protein
MLTPHQSFWAAVTRAVRTPSRLDQDVEFNIFDQFYTPSPGAPPIPLYFQIQGDPKLKAEQLIGYAAGYRAQVNTNLYLDFTAFYNGYNDLLGYGPIGLTESVMGNPPAPYLFFVLPYANAIEGSPKRRQLPPGPAETAADT